MTTSETKQTVVNKIKELGFNNRQISVSVRRGQTEAMIIVTIRQEGIDKAKIEAEVEKFERTYKDETTGEILAGGNCFIYVRKELKAAA